MQNWFTSNFSLYNSNLLQSNISSLSHFFHNFCSTQYSSLYVFSYQALYVFSCTFALYYYYTFTFMISKVHLSHCWNRFHLHLSLPLHITGSVFFFIFYILSRNANLFLPTFYNINLKFHRLCAYFFILSLQILHMERPVDLIKDIINDKKEL